jgi:hypothetical protein
MYQNQPDSTPIKNKHIMESDIKALDSMSKASLLEGYASSNIKTIPS